ncbi:hypothetical protein [Streptomyces plumbidurans]|uniref:hypothetical protein n=1 Tax=Streptomyces plumbidurans TaxID=2814589 RepID=UPI0027E0C3FE|nr:hypothetical protein [Streptomyces plumbidurans]
MTEGATVGALQIVTDPAHGGRWTSLSAGGREWLWRRDGVGRERVSPGDAFVDAGGLEECVPTVRGTPDHGEAWSRAWTSDGAGTESVRCERFSLHRTVGEGGRVDYVLSADPGFRFVWAAHALLDLSSRAVVQLPEGADTRLYPTANGPWMRGSWPTPAGTRLDRFGPDDGTAVGAVVDAARACVHDDEDCLSFALEVFGGAAQPVSIALWRNLGGFPDTGPYRSTGVEPMLGRVFDLAEAGPGDAAEVPASGEVRWRLTVTAACNCP